MLVSSGLSRSTGGTITDGDSVCLLVHFVLFCLLGVRFCVGAWVANKEETRIVQIAIKVNGARLFNPSGRILSSGDRYRPFRVGLIAGQFERLMTR